MKYIPQFEPQIKFNYVMNINKQIFTGWLGPGNMCKLVEQYFTKKILINRYNRLTTSGTTALLIAIKSLDLPKNSTIAFPAYTFLAGANAAKFLRYKVKLIDIKENTLSMNPDSLAKIINKIDAVIFVNHNGYGNTDLYKIHQLCFKNNIPLIEDSSQALGIPEAGLTGDISIISFSVPKIITSGQGGLISTNNINYYNKIKEIIDHGDNNWRKLKLHIRDGVNFKFNDILASYLYAQLKDFKYIKRKKEKIFNEYRKYIKLIDFNYKFTWMVLYKTKYAKKIIKELRKNNIQAVKYYRPLYHNPIYNGTKTKYPIAEKVYNETIYLPSSLNLTKKQIKKICNVINRIENE